MTKAGVEEATIRYRIARGLVRIWLGLFFPKTRLLNGEVLPPSGAAMLAVNHPASFRDLLILTAAFERPLCGLVSRKLLRGFWRRLFAWCLGTISFEVNEIGRRSALDAACVVLDRQGALVVFAETARVGPGAVADFWDHVATIALEAHSRRSDSPDLGIFPVHFFYPAAQFEVSEILIHVDRALHARELIPPEATRHGEGANKLVPALAEACRHNVFGLEAHGLRQFLSELEEVLRGDLEEEWGARRRWKQKVDGFELSGFFKEWVEQLNGLQPANLVGLRTRLRSYREARRRCLLRQAEVECGGAWVKSWIRRVAVWVETGLGFPVAAYGLANHLLAGLSVLEFEKLNLVSGLSRTGKWSVRAIALLVWYALQIALSASWFGRATAGAYALTLPLSGAYLWRYTRLLRRTRLAFLRARSPRQASRLHRMRKEFIQELEKARNVYVEMLGLAH